MTFTLQIACIILSYLLGSIPFGYIFTRIAGYGDIRSIGSGNIGATNVLRTGNKKLAALTFFFDALKGAVAVVLTHAMYPEFAPIAGLAALLGHMYPVWLKFKGGKGVATSIGVLAAMAWPVGVATVAIWLLIAYTSRYSSLAALLSFGLAPAFVLIFGHGDWLWLAVSIWLLVLWKHADNIQRLRTGKEPRIGEHRHETPAA